ncbi:MAG TPA: hypothetical protein VGN25_04590, partial [Solirubrobacteraceae bacterium]|nr:hypothetical protein [Solirubrobacteraceae bacterium]
MTTLSTKLAEQSRLEGFSSYGTVEKQQIIKSLGVDDYLNQQYRSGSPGELVTHYELELDEASRSEVEDYGNSLVED